MNPQDTIKRLRGWIGHDESCPHLADDAHFYESACEGEAKCALCSCGLSNAIRAALRETEAPSEPGPRLYSREQVEAEREACAVIADTFGPDPRYPDDGDSGWNKAARKIAAKIRARRPLDEGGE